MEEAKSVQHKSCNACAIGALCLSDGPIPDFEIAGLLGIYALAPDLSESGIAV